MDRKQVIRTLWASAALALLLCACKAQPPQPGTPAKKAKAAKSAGSLAQGIDAEGLKFFNSVGGRLEIELTEPTEQIAPRLMNQKAPATARIKSIKLKPRMFENEDFRDLTAQELNRVVLRSAEISMRGFGAVVGHKAPGNGEFTVRDLLQAVEETERQTRKDSEWFGGVDVHHVFFEGLHLDEKGVWEIYWGS